MDAVGTDHIPMRSLENEIVDSAVIREIRDDLEEEVGSLVSEEERREDLREEIEEIRNDTVENLREKIVEEIKEDSNSKPVVKAIVKEEMEDAVTRREIAEKIDEAYAKKELKEKLEDELEVDLPGTSKAKNGDNSLNDGGGSSYFTSQTHLVKEVDNELNKVVEAAQKERKLRPILCALAICLGSFAMGCVIGYPSPAVPNLNQCCDDNDYPVIEDCCDHRPFSLDTEQSSWIGSIITLTGLFGGLVGGIYMDMVGRQMGLMLMAVPMAAGWVIIASSPSYGCMLAGRAVTGLAMGVMSVICPVYIAEISPPSIRGFLGSSHQLFVCISILYTYCFGYFLSWQWLVVAILGPLLLMGVVLCFIVDSPRHLLSTGQKEACEESLLWLRGKDVDINIARRELEVALESSKEKARLSEYLEPQLWKPLAISCGLMVFQQFSGINVVMFYTVDIFTMAQIDMNPNVQTIIVGVVGVVGTLVSVAVADLVGRRILLLASGFLMAISMAGMGAFFYELEQDSEFATGTLSWLPVTCLVLFNFGFDVAYGPIPWLMMGELFPQRAKGLASSVATALNWLCAFIMTKCWTSMTDTMGVYGGYWFCAGFCVLSMVFIITVVPETKGRTLDEIERYFKGSR